MSIFHVTNGDIAAESLREALRLAERDERVVPLKDDLAVGQLRGIDDNSENRALFWQHVLSEAKFDFIAKLKEQDALLHEIVGDSGQVVVWHGQSAADQLTLRRVAYALRNAPQRLNEARFNHADFIPGRERPHRIRADDMTAAGMFTPAEFLAKLPSAAPISVLRISRLALEWQEVKQINSDTRRWRDNTFIAGTYSDIDEAILHLARGGWKRVADVVAQVMGMSFGFLVNEAVAFWRCRELIAAGKLDLRGELSRLAEAEICRPAM